MREIQEAARLVQEQAHEDANIIFGASIDEQLGENVKVTVIATGFDAVERMQGLDSGARIQAPRDMEIPGHACGPAAHERRTLASRAAPLRAHPVASVAFASRDERGAAADARAGPAPAPQYQEVQRVQPASSLHSGARALGVELPGLRYRLGCRRSSARPVESRRASSTSRPPGRADSAPRGLVLFTLRVR